MKMKSFMKGELQTLDFMQKVVLEKLLSKLPWNQGGALEYILKKYAWHFLIVLALVFLSLASKFLPVILKKPQPVLSIDSLVPKDFVLVPIEIVNGADIVNIMGKYGVVDLYAYSQSTNLPNKQAASALKILPPETEEGRFLALVPEKQASLLFEYPDPFYAVIQNPNKKSSKIYKKKEKKSFIVIEENF